MSNQAVIAIEQLTIRYGKKTACADVSLKVPRGAVYALLGRNGAGKSSLVRCLLGQQKPTSGSIALFGEDVWKRHVWKRRARLMPRVGATPEEPDAPPAVTAKQLSTFRGRLYGSWDHQAVDQRLARFGVPADVAFGLLSKSQKGEIMLALALGHHPELLVLDDPTLGLDVVARKAFSEELVGELADRGTTVFMTTHDPSGFDGIATHIGILREGRMILDEELEALKSRFRVIRYSNERTATRASYGTELDAFDAVRVKVRGWGIEAVVSNFEDSAFEQFRSTDGVIDAEVAPMSLEEIFVSVAGETRALA